MPKSYHYFGYCLLLLSEAEMPSEKRRIQERETTKGGSKEEHITTLSEIRNQCGQEQLSDLLLLSIQKDIPIDKEEVMKASLLKLCIFKMSIWRNLSVT